MSVDAWMAMWSSHGANAKPITVRNCNTHLLQNLQAISPSTGTAKLFFTNRIDIRAINVNGLHTEKIVKYLHNAVAIDFHYE